MRTSTALVSFDLAEGVGITASGRPYALEGVDIRIVEPESAAGMIISLSNAPFKRGPMNWPGSARSASRMVGRDIRLQAGPSRAGRQNAAEAAAIPLDHLRMPASREGAAAGLAVEEAESALSVIAARAKRLAP